MTQLLDRSSFKRTLLGRVRAALDGAAMIDVGTSRSFPGRATEREHVWLDTIRGVVTVRAMTGPGLPKPQHDKYDVDVVVRTAVEGVTAEEAEDRVEEIVSVINDALAPCSFSSTDGGLTYQGVFRLAGYDGPMSENPNETGWVGVAILTVTVEAFIG